MCIAEVSSWRQCQKLTRERRAKRGENEAIDAMDPGFSKEIELQAIDEPEANREAAQSDNPPLHETGVGFTNRGGFDAVAIWLLAGTQSQGPELRVRIALPAQDRNDSAGSLAVTGVC